MSAPKAGKPDRFVDANEVVSGSQTVSEMRESGKPDAAGERQ